MHRRIRRLAISLLLAPAAALAGEDPIATDRPDRTESAHTVPAGRWQLEMDVASWARHASPDGLPGTVEALDVAPFNLKLGISPHADLQVVMAPWSRTRHTAPSGVRTEDAGAGDLTGRIKLRVLRRERVAAWGALVPVAVPLRGGRALGAMLVVEKERGLDAWTGGSLTLATPLRGALAGFVECYGARAGFGRGAPAEVTLDAGLTFAAHDDLQFDAGVYRGITEAAEDWRVFAGLAVRR